MRAGLDAERRGLEREAGLLLAHLRVEREDRGPGTIHRHFDLLTGDRVTEQEAERLGEKVEAEDVLAVSREDVLHRDAAARAWWRALNARHLRSRLRQLERRLCRRAFGITDRQHRDAAGRAQVAFHQRRRERLHVGDIVETVADGVGRQERRDVDAEVEQVLDLARVFGAVQPLKRTPAWIRVRHGERIHARLERTDQLLEDGRRRALRAARRHHAGAQLVDHLLGDVTMLRCGLGVPAGERQPASLAAFAVAGGAVLRHHLGLGRRRQRRGMRGNRVDGCGFLGSLLRCQRQREQTHDKQDREKARHWAGV